MILGGQRRHYDEAVERQVVNWPATSSQTKDLEQSSLYYVVCAKDFKVKNKHLKLSII